MRLGQYGSCLEYGRRASEINMFENKFNQSLPGGLIGWDEGTADGCGYCGA